MLGWVKVGKKIRMLLSAQWQWFMLVCTISATEICITMLDEDCYTDDAEHTFTNFSHDGKTEYITRNLIKNLCSFHITYNIAAYAQSQSEDRYERDMYFVTV